MNKKLLVMVETAVMTALAVVLSLFAVFKMPQGGSVSLTMVPIFLIAFRRGPIAGISCGLLSGLIMQFMGEFYHPLSFLLDYFVAYGVLGVAGFFRRYGYVGIVSGTVLGTLLRYICSLLSGAVLFADYAPEGQNPWIYSLGYNATYMVPELIICIVVMVVLYAVNKSIFRAVK